MKTSTKYLIGACAFVIGSGILCQIGLYFMGISFFLCGLGSAIAAGAYAESGR